MIRCFCAALASLALASCATGLAPTRVSVPTKLVEVQILAFNDFHGNLETPEPVEITEPDGTKHKIATGGVAHLASALVQLRRGEPNTITVSAGDTIGASPLISANFLDEPAIEAMNLLGLEINSVGNHEFDRGSDELKRMQAGGCARYTARVPCAVEPFRGARFRYLAANVVQTDGSAIFPSSAIKRFRTPAGTITIGFIGETLKDTEHLVTPSGVRGLRFEDEARTANALVPKLKAEGVDAIVLLIHQGGKTARFTRGNNCEGLTGDIVPILKDLDPAITTVVSGHTHWAYVCHHIPGISEGRLLTSAGKYGYFVTDLRLEFDPASHKLVRQDAHNVTVGNGQYGTDPDEKALVARYFAAVTPIASRVVGHLTAPATRNDQDGESAAADLIADSMLAASKGPNRGGAEIALVNATGVRVDLPAGDVRYDAAFRMMPFGNNLVVMSMTGAQLKSALEQQYGESFRAGFSTPSVLAPSQGFTYAVDMSKAVGNRVFDLRLNGRLMDPSASYRISVNNYVASGGDNLSVFTSGTNVTDNKVIDLDALIDWIARGRAPPVPNRVRILGIH